MPPSPPPPEAAPLPPPPPPPASAELDLHTTTSILRRAAAAFSNCLLPLVLASLIILSFRTALLTGTLHVSTLTESDPTLRTLLHRLSRPSPLPLPRPRPVLRLSRSPDFQFPSSDPFPAAPFPVPRNSSFLFPHPFPHPRFPVNNNPYKDHPRQPQEPHQLTSDDLLTIIHILAILSSTHSLAILFFILAYSSVLGIVFLSTTCFLLNRTVPLSAVLSGARMGFNRLSGSVFLRWAGRDAVIQFLCICFFSDIQDQVKLFKLFVRVKLMPFSITAPFILSPWFSPLGEDLAGFVYMWGVVEFASAVILAVNPFVVIVDYRLRRRGPEAVKEGFYLANLMMKQAIWVKMLETLVCGRVVREVLVMVGGRMFAMAVQSVAEVYFMVVWLVFYFAARCRDGEVEGRRFGRSDLEDCINGIR